MTPVTNNKIQQEYQKYAFLEVPSGAVVESKTEDNVITIWHDIVSRSYELPEQWYMVVFSPINKSYIKDPDFFKVKGLDHCRKMFKKPSAYIMTREIVDCAKIHVNALVCTTQDLNLHNTKIYSNKYYVHVQTCSAPQDRDRVLTYITKEKQKRPFLKYLDYLHYSKTT